jgi:alpha-1,3-rhamnosyl/mannosyltransferase
LVIAFDTFFLTKQFRNVGIYEYSKNLLIEFHRLAEQDSSIAIRYFVSPGYSDDVVGGKFVPGCIPVNTSLLRFHKLWRLGLVNVAAGLAGADVIFTTSPNIFPLRILPVAVTIHDIISKRLPAELVEGSTGLRVITRLAAKFSQKVITDSQHSRQDLIEAYKLPPEKVSVVYLGYDRNTFNPSAPDADARKSLLLKLGIQGPYILHHGMVQLRKNVGRLIKAYGLLMKRRSDLDLQLVLAGPFGLGSEQIVRTANGGITPGKVIFTGPLPGPELALLIKEASLCVIPSLYEGFCLPMVEAMACGVPTIASNTSCLPEVSGGELRYFDPLSEEDIAATMEKVLESNELQDELARRGLKRASQFSWQRCARETIQTLRDSNVDRSAASAVACS